MNKTNNFNFSHQFKPLTHSKNKKDDDASIFLKIGTDEYGYFIETIDERGLPCKYDPSLYTSSRRLFIDAYNRAIASLTSAISWDRNQDVLYLNEYFFLLDLIQADMNVIDNGGAKVKQALHEKVKVQFYIQPENEDTYNCSPNGMINGEIIEGVKIISPHHCLCNGELMGTSNSILNQEMVPHITTSFSKDNLSLFLSILSSYITTEDWHLKDYSILRKNNPITSELNILIDKVDEENNLYVRVGQSSNTNNIGIEESLYTLTSVVELDDENRIATITPYEIKNQETLENDFYKKLVFHLSRKAVKDIGIVSPYFIMNEETANKFVVQVIPNMLDEYEFFGVEKLKTFKITTTKPTINSSLSPGLDYFEGDISLDFGDEKIDLFEVLSQWKKQKYIKLNNGTNALIADKYIEKLQRLFTKKEGKGRLSFFDLPLAEELLSDQLESSVFEKQRSVFEGFNTISPIVKAKKIKAKLRDYQAYGLGWLQYLHNNNLNGCLADDMGLGKTVQTLSLLSLVNSKKTSLIVMPRTLLYNWQKEIEKFAPHLSFQKYYGADRNVIDIGKSKLILTTYGIVRNDIENLKDHDFEYVILDESQNIKNFNAKTTKAVLMLKSDHKLALSGTPLENNLGELYSLFRFLNPAMFGSMQKFNSQYLVPIQKHGDEDVTQALRLKIYPFILRRLKKDVLDELPEKIENVIYVDQSPEQKKEYEKRRQIYKVALDKMIQTEGIKKSQFFIFQAFAELRQLASIPEAKTEGRIKSPKLEFLAEHMIQSILNGHKVLVFANFLAAVEHISTILTDNDIHHVTMTGATSNRQKVINEFKENEKCKAFVMTLKTGGTGLTLTEADIVYIFDPWWNGAAETQAIDRAHRIGQDKTVLSYRLIAKDTIEEKILQLQNMKKELFDNLISTDSSVSKSLSEEDLEFIFE